MAKTLDEAGVKRLIQEIKGANKNLNAPIPISTENTPESMAQNVRNIADYVAKAKAAGIDTTKSFGITLEIYGYPVKGNIQYSLIYGLLITDNGFIFLYEIDVTTGEVFPPCEIVTAHSIQKVTSSMLDKGARNPIIITGDMTEVDEETYQKLLSDDVDVVFKDDTNFRIISLTSKIVNDIDEFLRLEFCQAIQDSETFDDACFIRVYVSIKKSLPHTTTISNNTYFLTESLDNSGYLNKSTLSPVLQEIDLTGTDAERKAKLDQFETDWKALTGADDLTGARFVGKFGITDDIERNVTGIMTYSAGDAANEKNDNCFYGICNGYSFSKQKSQIAVKVSCTDGSLTITPLFSHLEAITIYTDNTPEHKQANLDNIAAYKANLQALGVDTTKGWNAPVKVNAINGISSGIFTSTGENSNTPYTIISGLVGEYPYIIRINKTSGASTMWEILCDGRNYARITTTAKSIISAINEVNALAKGYSTIFTPIELTTETAQNKTAIDARVAAFTAQGISLTNGCCIPVTYKGVYAGNINLINGDWYGLLVKNTNNPADNINIKLSADGTITEGNSVQ